MQPCLDLPSPLQLCFLCARGILHACSGAGVETDWADSLCEHPMSALRCTLSLGSVRSDCEVLSLFHGDFSYPEWGAPYQLIFLPKRYCLQVLLVLSSKLSNVERMLPQQLICYVHASPALELLILHTQESGPCAGAEADMARAEVRRALASLSRLQLFLHTEDRSYVPTPCNRSHVGLFTLNRKFLPWSCKFQLGHTCSS